MSTQHAIIHISPKNKTQFLVYDNNKLNTDRFSISIFELIIIPFRVRTGRTAQELAKYLQTVVIAIFFAGAIAIHEIANSIFIIVVCVVMQLSFHNVYKELSILSDNREIKDLDLSALLRAIHFARARVTTLYIYLVLVAIDIWWSPWWTLWIFGLTAMLYMRDTALTCGGAQVKKAKEKKLAFIPWLRPLPGRG